MPLLRNRGQRDADIWGVNLLDAAQQGLDPDYPVADAGAGLRAGQIAVWGGKPCHGDVFHVRQQCEALELAMDAAKDVGDGCGLSARLGRARQAEVQVRKLAADVKILTGWLAP